MVKIVRLTSIRAYLTLCYLSLTCSSLNSLNKSACLSAESGMSAPADHPRLIEKADARSEIRKYFAHIADSKGKPTNTTMPFCKRCFKSKMTKGVNTSVSICSVTVCHCETTPTLSAGSEKAERSCTPTRCRAEFMKYRY